MSLNSFGPTGTAGPTVVSRGDKQHAKKIATAAGSTNMCAASNSIDYWQAKEFLAWYATNSTVNQTAVWNDRWGRDVMVSSCFIANSEDH